METVNSVVAQISAGCDDCQSPWPSLSLEVTGDTLLQLSPSEKGCKYSQMEIELPVDIMVMKRPVLTANVIRPRVNIMPKLILSFTERDLAW